MKILRASDYKRMPWKNGGGETVEITVFPAKATVDDFDWRISMARVASNGLFSIFPEIDRTLSILDGAGLSLAIDGAEPVLLDKDSEPLRFAADIPVDATPTDGAITDLNVMTRRGQFCHSVERETGSATISPNKRNQMVFLIPTGSVSLASNGERITLEPLDAALIETDTVVTGENIVSYVIRIDPA